jgi:hypothetical protein
MKEERMSPSKTHLTISVYTIWVPPMSFGNDTALYWMGSINEDNKLMVSASIKDAQLFCSEIIATTFLKMFFNTFGVVKKLNKAELCVLGKSSL